jgi:hypothetical protein
VELEDAANRKDNGRQDGAVIETEQANQDNSNQARDHAVSAGDLKETKSQEPCGRRCGRTVLRVCHKEWKNPQDATDV